MSAAPHADPPEPEVVARAPGVTGGELVLRRVGGHFEIISNGVFLMDTRGGVSEREMVRASLAALPAGRTGIRVLIGGLGMGFSAYEALGDERVAHVRVIELEPRVIEWHSGPLAPVGGNLPEEPRCELVRADLTSWLHTASETFDAVCLDIDNGPRWTVVEGNDRLYQPDALERLRRLVTPGGVIAFWSAMRAPEFSARLREYSTAVWTVEVPVPRGEPDVVYLARP